MSNKSLEEYNKRKEDISEKNSWYVCNEVKDRVHDSPGPAKDFMIATITPKLHQGFFHDQKYLKEFLEKKSLASTKLVPGHGYYSKIENFIQKHYQIGELCIEYLKFDCQKQPGTGVACDHCEGNSWVGPPIKRVPKPYPDIIRRPEFHYLPAKDTPLELNNKPRLIG